MITRKMTLDGKVNMDDILNMDVFFDIFLSRDVFVENYVSTDKKLTIYIAEPYYMRIESNLSVTVIVEELDDKVNVDIISSGGQKGFWGLSWGAESNATDKVASLLELYGFVEIDSVE